MVDMSFAAMYRRRNQTFFANHDKMRQQTSVAFVSKLDKKTQIGAELTYELMEGETTTSLVKTGGDSGLSKGFQEIGDQGSCRHYRKSTNFFYTWRHDEFHKVQNLCFWQHVQRKFQVRLRYPHWNGRTLINCGQLTDGHPTGVVFLPVGLF